MTDPEWVINANRLVAGMRTWRRLSKKECAEFHRREYNPDEWVKWKQELDTLLAFRKTIKGKPTEEQMWYITENAREIKRLKILLWGEEFV